MASRNPTLQVKTAIDKALTQTYLRKLSRNTFLATVCTIFIVSCSLVWLVFQFGSSVPIGRSNALVFFSNSMYAFCSIIGAWWCFGTVLSARYGPVRLSTRHQLAWLLIGLGLLSNAAGGVIYTYLEDYIMRNPVPSPADIGFTLFYIFTFIGLLLMPTAQQSARSRVRIGLDAVITTLCILEFSWYFVIKPIFGNATDPGTLYVSASYPFWDILLILAIVLVFYQGVEQELKPALILCALGVISQIVADTLYAITVTQNTYNTGTWYIDTFWFLGYLLIGLAAPYQYASIARKTFREHLQASPENKSAAYASFNDSHNKRRRMFLLYAIMAYARLFLMLSLILYAQIKGAADLIFMSIVVAVGALIVLRWYIASDENDKLLEEREQRQYEADLLRSLTAQLAEELQLKQVLDCVITIVTIDLRFDAAMLLLIEDYDRPLNAGSSLLVHTVSANSREIVSWQLEGEQFLDCAVLHGKPVEMLSDQNSVHLPEELFAWHKENRILSTLFIPLTYQGKIQGSLGFSNRSAQPFSPREVYLAHAFAEQVARAIEHARLYEQSQEHEQFAQALSAVAARLNSTMVADLESITYMYQLICDEGARALQADYAILYLPVLAPTGHLYPVASYANEQEATPRAREWPPIGSYEREARALQELQPTLIDVNSMSTSGQFPAISKSGPLSLVLAPGNLSQSDTAPQRAQTGSLRGGRGLTLRVALALRNTPTAILAPLIAGDKAVALLVLARSLRTGARHTHTFASTDLAHAQDFAEQAAIAFTNAQLYGQLREAHQQLQELDQLKDQFMVTASHELRTPLTSVQGYLELLAQFGPELPVEQQQEFLQKARRGCDELVLLLSNVMDASRLEIEAGIRPGNLQAVPTLEVIRDVLTLIEPQLTQECREAKIFAPEQVSVKADPARLRQVLLNLSSNALKYSPGGSPIAYHVRVLQGRSAAVISVSDRGNGIPPEEQAQLFQRFVRLERDLNSSVRGSGLGLYISRRLVEAMGGTIGVESSGIPGSGSTFHVQLPIA